VSAIKFFDCSVMIGMRRIMNPGSFYSTGELIRKMEYYGISEALAYHSLAAGYNPAIGNETLLDEIKDIPRLRPAWVVMPHHTGEFPPPDELLEKMKRDGVRAVRMYPADHTYSLAEYSSGELLSALEEKRVPIFLGWGQAHADVIERMMSAHPGLRLVLTDFNGSAARNVYALMKKYAGIHIETIMFKPLEGIEDVCAKFGAGRLLFGSGAPLYSGGAAMAMVNYASVTDDERRMIAGENLERLLGEATI